MTRTNRRKQRLKRQQANRESRRLKRVARVINRLEGRPVDLEALMDVYALKRHRKTFKEIYSEFI